MAGLNRAMIIGNVGNAPEIRTAADGRKVASFSLATSEKYKKKETGELVENTDWHRVVCFNQNLCGVIEQYVKKGSKLYVEGQMKTRKWTDNSGIERYTTEVVLSAFRGEIQLLDSKGNGGSYPPAAEASDYDDKTTGAAYAPSNAPGFDDQVPW